MLPGSINNLLRIAGIIISSILAAQPWFIATGSEDPFLLSGWAILAGGSLSACILSVIFLFFRPRQGQIPFAGAFLLLFFAITVSTLASNFLTSLRTSIMLVTLMISVIFLRLSRQQSDNLIVASMISLSGFMMAIYGIAQFFGHDILIWNSDYSMVGTFSNPAYYAIFLAVTTVITLGLTRESALKKGSGGNMIWLMLLTQILALFLCNRTGVTLCFIVALTLYFSKHWEIRPGRFLRKSPFIAGLILALVLTIFHGIVYYSTTHYPWETLQNSPYGYFPIVSRLILWQMGYAIFAEHPLYGLGAGAIPYLMPSQRPPLGSALGIKTFNDDPHSAAITILAETGFMGLIAICSIIAVAYGCFARQRFKNQKECDNIEVTEQFSASATTESDQPESSPNNPIQWNATGVTALIIALAHQAGFINNSEFLYLMPLLIAVFGIHNFFNNLQSSHPSHCSPDLPKSTMIALLTFIVYSLFNSIFATLPLLGFMALIFSLHFSACQRDIVWKRKFSYISIIFISFPAFYVFAGYNLQIAYHQEQINLASGEKLMKSGCFAESQLAFEQAIQANFQSLKAHYGLAISLKKQNRLDESQEVLKRLDSMVPNAFSANYELAQLLLERKQILEAHRYALRNLQWDQAPRAYELLGKILLLEGKQREAENIFSEGLLLIPANQNEKNAADMIRLNLAAIAANRGDFSNCEKMLQALSSQARENADAMYLNGLILSRQKEHTKALEAFEKALEQYPQNPRFMNAVGYILTEKGEDLERAQNLLESAYQSLKQPDPPNLSDLLMVAHSLGKLYWKQGKFEEAGKLMEIAYEQCPDEWAILRQDRLADLQEFYRTTGKSQEPER